MAVTMIMTHKFLRNIGTKIYFWKYMPILCSIREMQNSDLVLKTNIQLLGISSSLVLLGFMVHHSIGVQRIYKTKQV
jgi:hypothetical protein